METLIDSVATAASGAVSWLVSSGAAFVIFAAIWLGFGVALVRSQGSVDSAWRRIRATSIALQLLIWLLFLPVMLGLWIWETTWPLVVRASLVLGIASWNLLIFLPNAAR